MRVATVVLGIVFAVTGGASEAADTAKGSVLKARSAAVLADGSLSTPYFSHMGGLSDGASQTGALHAREYAARDAMGFVPSQNPASFVFPRLPAEQPRQEASARFNPASIPLPATRTLEDHMLTGFIALMLIAYQLRRKHRFLRPHQFST